MPSKETFVNRVSELRILTSDISARHQRNTIVFLQGVSGVGKSAFTRRLLQGLQTEFRAKVEILAGNHTDGYYIGQIARTLDLVARLEGNIDLVSFLRSVTNRDIRQRYESLLLSTQFDFDSLPANRSLATVLQHRADDGRLSIEALFRVSLAEATLMLADYVKYLLSNQRTVLNIENIQTIDYASLQLLEEILSQQGGHYFILEYTLDKPGLHDISALEDVARRTGCSVRREKLDKLPFGDVVKLISDKQVISLLESVYIHNNGNLRQLQDLEVILHSTYPAQAGPLDLQTRNPTRARIEALNRSSIFLLCGIVAHKGAVHLDILRGLLDVALRQHGILVDLEETLEDLSTHQFIVVRDLRAAVSHDSITDVVSTTSSFQKYISVALKAWISVYEEIYESGTFEAITKNEVIFSLFYFYLAADITRLLLLIQQIKQLALGSLFPKTMLNLLEKLREALRTRYDTDPRTLDIVTLALLDIYYSLGLFEEGFEVLSEVQESSLRRNLYHAALLDRLDRHHEAIHLIEHLVENNKGENLSYELSLKLILMTSYRSLNRYSECLAIFQGVIEKSVDYSSVLEYGYFLRNSEMVLSFRASIESLKKSVEFFSSRRDSTAEAHSRISLGMRYATLGDLDLAQVELDTASRILDGNTMERHVILNNKAAVYLYFSPPNWQEALELLTQGMRTVTTSFDRITIYNNMAIAASMGKRWDLLTSIEPRLVSLLESQPDKVMHRFTYYNLAFCASQRGSIADTEFFIGRARVIGDEGDDYWAHRLKGDVLRDQEYLFLASFPFEAGFISYWHFPVGVL
jgi:tetratricopeptide (TPR) repeat protein